MSGCLVALCLMFIQRRRLKAATDDGWTTHDQIPNHEETVAIATVSMETAGMINNDDDDDDDDGDGEIEDGELVSSSASESDLEQPETVPQKGNS